MIREALKILEAGEAAGKLEIIKTPLPKAKEFAEKAMRESDRDLEKELPDFDVNYEKAKKLANLGKTQRKDMPVIEIADVQAMQKKLTSGSIDISAPYSDDTKKNNNNPFPEGLDGKRAERWMKDGLKLYDGDAKDDIVKSKMEMVEVGKIKPIQKQVYFDKALVATAEFGSKGTRKFLENDSILILSSDGYLADGHHRLLSAMIIDPKMKVKCIVIDLPMKVMLKLLLSYSDAIGNKRNL